MDWILRYIEHTIPILYLYLSLCPCRCRHWQDLGFHIVYVTARPDMQQKKVVTWLAQHNFPHGMVSFIDGLSADPLRQKANYLKHLRSEVRL